MATVDTAHFLPPIRCYSCGSKKVNLAHNNFIYRVYVNKENPKDVLNDLGVQQLCCRMNILSAPVNEKYVAEIKEEYEYNESQKEAREAALYASKQAAKLETAANKGKSAAKLGSRSRSRSPSPEPQPKKSTKKVTSKPQSRSRSPSPVRRKQSAKRRASSSSDSESDISPPAVIKNPVTKTTSKPCPPGKIRNPTTNRCIDEERYQKQKK
jgi:DNA-directed RNA polymerase subunit N (RpoN/RPB10)